MSITYIIGIIATSHHQQLMAGNARSHGLESHRRCRLKSANDAGRCTIGKSLVLGRLKTIEDALDVRLRLVVVHSTSGESMQDLSGLSPLALTMKQAP
jgi:hypothetical protein